MERAIEQLAAIQFAVIGLSHVFAPRAWAEFFIKLRDDGHAGVFWVAFMSLWFGSIVAAFHNVWSGIPMVLTVVGWAQVIKGLVYYVAPGVAIRRMEIVTLDRAHIFVYPGVALVGLAGLLAYHLATTG
jgi:hypothetical protein